MPRIDLTLIKPNTAARALRFDCDVVTMGRSSECQIPLDDRYLSRKHAEIVAESGAWVLRDNGSTNGTYLNGKRVTAPVTLKPGDRVQLGSAEVVFGEAGAGATSADDSGISQSARRTSMSPGNNWVDYRSSQRYREYYSFPGKEIDEVGGTDFGKAMLEWTLPPWRFKRFGVTGLYSNWARLALFGGGLVTNMGDDDLRREVANAGAQIDFSVVMFSNLESMVSAGYAKAFEHGEESDEFMISLRLLK